MNDMNLTTKVFTGNTTVNTVIDLTVEGFRQVYLKGLMLYANAAATNFTLSISQQGGATKTIAVIAVSSGATTMLAGDDIIIDVQKGDKLFVQSSVAASVATITLQDYDK